MRCLIFFKIQLVLKIGAYKSVLIHHIKCNVIGRKNEMFPDDQDDDYKVIPRTAMLKLAVKKSILFYSFDKFAGLKVFPL